MNKKDIHQKEKDAILQKDWVKNNPIFTNDHISDFYDLFVLYADPRTKRADVRDILVTARTLGLNSKFTIVANGLEQLASSYDGPIDFETFIKDLTEKMGNPFDQQGRKQLFELIDVDQKGSLNEDDLQKIADELRFNLSAKDIQEVIHNVGGFEADEITEEKFEKYLAKRIQRKQLEQELLRNK